MMAKVEATLTIRLQDWDRTKLFIWELRQLEDEMRVMASPHTERLERAIDRWLLPDDKPGDPE